MSFKCENADTHELVTTDVKRCPTRIPIFDSINAASPLYTAVPLQPRRESSDHHRCKKLYDPYDYGNSDTASSSVQMTAYVLLFSLGPILFNIPHSFVTVGYGTGVIGTCATVLLYAYCMRMVLSTEYELCKRFTKPNMTYTEMTRRAFECGPRRFRWFSKYTEMTLCVVFVANWTIGSACMFLLASENTRRAYELLFDTQVHDVRTVMLYLLVPLTALWWIPNLNLLLSFAIFPNLVNVAYIGIVAYYTLQDLPPLRDRATLGDPMQIPLFVGVLLFSLNITGIVLPLKNEMKKPKKFNSRVGVITLSYCVVTAMYSMFGFIGYLKYGDQLLESVIWNLPSTRLTRIAFTLYAFGNCFYHPLCGYVCYDIVWNTILKKKHEKSKFQFHYEYACRTLISLMTITLAFVLPKIDLFMLLTGSVCTSIDSLIIPALAQVLIYYDQRRYSLYLVNGTIIVVGIVLMVCGGVDSVRKIIANF